MQDKSVIINFWRRFSGVVAPEQACEWEMDRSVTLPWLAAIVALDRGFCTVLQGGLLQGGVSTFHGKNALSLKTNNGFFYFRK